MTIAKATGPLWGTVPELKPKQEVHRMALWRVRDLRTLKSVDLFGLAASTVYRSITRAGERCQPVAGCL